MGISSLSEIQDIYRALGIKTLFVKELAPKQDNEKNQIFLGTDVGKILASFPGEISFRQPSQSVSKRASRPGIPITEMALNLSWLDHSGAAFKAPGAKLIGYFQYPEARLSGFLSGAKWSPEAIRRDYQEAYGTRYLFLGTHPSGEIYTLLITERDDPLARSFPDLPNSDISAVLKTVPFEDRHGLSPAQLLEARLREIIAGGWHASIRNAGGKIIPFKGNQGAGFTLEALLGVETNALKEPDILGHEVKSFRGGKISLMTPVADQGPEGAMSFRAFMGKYGHPSHKDDGSLRFTGVAKSGQVNERTGLTIRVAGYDQDSDCFSEDPGEIRIELFNDETGELISAWSLERLAVGWNTKHAFAVYVPAEADSGDNNRYRFQYPLYFCSGTSIWNFLRAVAHGVVYYDPAHAVYKSGEAKQRPQWRLSTSRFSEKLSMLYDTVRVVTQVPEPEARTVKG